MFCLNKGQMEEKKEGNIFSVIKNYWRRSPSTMTRFENSFAHKEHGEAYQNTYSNFSVNSDSARQIYTDTSKKKESPKKTMKDIFFQYCDEATIHGIRHICPTSNKIRRFLYVVIVLLFTVVLLNLLLGVLILYSKHPYKSYYFAKVMKLLDFPTVTMCNVENMFAFPHNYTPNRTLKSVLDAYIPTSITIVECFFNSKKCFQTFPTIMIIRRQIHVCYIIRPASNRTFDMEDLKGDDGLFVDVSTRKSWAKGEKGVRVFLHEDKTFPSQMDSSFFAGPRDATFAVIQPEKVVKLGSPYHEPDEDCRDNDSPSFVNPLKFYKSYSVTNCQRECTGLYINEYCNCTLPYFPGKARQCTFYDYGHCVKIHLNASLSQNTYLHRCKCTPNCSYLQYDSRVSVAHMRYSNSKEENMFRIRIYFENMVMKFLQETPRYELDELLASFGGQMGLFLGASVISVYEFLEFSLIFVWSLLTTQFRKSEQQFKRSKAMRKKNVEG